MASIWDLFVTLGADTSGFSKGMDGAVSKSKSASSSIGSNLANIGKTVVTGMAVAVGAAAAATAAFTVSAIGAASDLNETVSKSGVVFGDQAGKILAFGQSAAKNLGMSTNEAIAAAATYGNLFVSMGMTNKSSADMSQGLVQLAGDLASFNNMPTADVLEKLRAGLTGETEPLKSLGVNINQAAIEAKAMSMGLGTSTVNMLDAAEAQLKLDKATKNFNTTSRKYGANSMQAKQAAIDYGRANENLEKVMKGGTTTLTAAQKAQASYALIMEQTTTAQGDFARTSDGLANQQRILGATFENVKTTLGTAFLPLAQQAAQQMNKWLSDPAIIGGLQNIANGIATFAQNAITYIPQVVAWFKQVGAWFMNNQGVIVAILGTLGLAVLVFGAQSLLAMAPIILTLGLVGLAIYLLYQAWTTNFAGIRDTLTAFWTNIGLPIFTTLKAWLDTNLPVALAWLGTAWTTVLLPAITSVFTWMRDTLIPFLTGPFWTTVQNVGAWIGTTLTGAFNGVRDAIRWVIGAINDLKAAIDSIPKVNLPTASSNPYGYGNNPGPGVTTSAPGKKGGRASGGYVFPGSSYTVGERGSETFTPSVPGFITPHNQYSMGAVTINIIGGDPNKTADAVARKLKAQFGGAYQGA
jgi:hypothetical protein